MANPLVNTKWTTFPFNGAVAALTITDDASFKANWQSICGALIPVQDYIFKFAGNRSEYLLAGIKAEDEGIFLNITKGNVVKYMPLDDQHLTLLRTDPFSGTITQVYGGAKPTATKKSSMPAPHFATGTTPNLPSKTFKEVIAKKIVTPKKTCPKCKGGMTLLFTSFSCDNGCK